jgi:ABC-type nitrate/sulfonate/bicarbonate transport system permease component
MATSRQPLKDGGVSPRRVLALRALIVAALLLGWQALAMSGLFYEDVVLGLPAIARGLAQLLLDPAFYRNLGITLAEVLAASAIGALAGLACGMALGGSRILERAFERYLYYLGPTPKIIFFPLMILWFGVGPGSKIALGALSCFFPVALAVAAGMREIPFILKCVGTSLRATPLQKTLKIYLPAMRGPAINGLRMGFGVAVIGVLLAETKLSNQGLGYLVIQNYQHFDMQAMYALLIAIFGLAVAANAALSRWAGPNSR